MASGLNIGSVLGKDWLKRLAPKAVGLPIDAKASAAVPKTAAASPVVLPTAAPAQAAAAGAAVGAAAAPAALPGLPIDTKAVGGVGAPPPEAAPAAAEAAKPKTEPGSMVQKFFDVGQLPPLGPIETTKTVLGMPVKATHAKPPVAASVAPAEPAPEVVGSDGYTDSQRAELEVQTKIANKAKAAEVDAASAQSQLPGMPIDAAPATPAAAAAPVETAQPATAAAAAPTDTAAAEVKPEEDLDNFLLDWYKTAATAKEDPTSKAAFNKAIMQFGRLNQAQQQSLQAKINADPRLAGQPQGTATLMMAARDANMELADLVANLGIEERKNVLEMNKLGIAGVAALNEIRKTETDRDIENMAEAIKRLAAAGNDVGARALFDQMTAKDPDRFDGIEFDGFLSSGEIDTLKNTAKQTALVNARTSFAQGDVADTVSSIESAYNEETRNTRGRPLVEDNDIATINKWLEGAGMDPITDKSELVGREGDVFTAEQISKMDKELNSNWLDVQTDSMLSDLGVDGTDPDVEKAVRSWLLDLKTTGGLTLDADGQVTFNPNTLLPPWDPKSTSAHLFQHWPVMDDEGNVIGGFNNPYDAEDPRPTPDSNPEGFQYMEEMDKAWESYVLNTASDERMTREQWFYATKGGQNKDDAGKVVVDPDVVPPGITPDDPVDELDAEEFANAITSEGKFGFIDGEPIDWESDVAKDYIKSIPKTPLSGVKSAKSFGKENLGKVVNFDGKLYYVEKGDRFQVGHSGNSDRTREYMELVGQDGKSIWMDSDGKTTTTPPVSDKNGTGQYYSEWFKTFK